MASPSPSPNPNPKRFLKVANPALPLPLTLPPPLPLTPYLQVARAVMSRIENGLVDPSTTAGIQIGTGTRLG